MVHFVGAGPGAPDLITVRGRALLCAADVVIYAGSLVNPALLSCVKDSCRVLDSARMTLPEMIAALQDAERAGLTTVRLHSGDPSVYGAIREQMRELDRLGISYDVTPGVTAFCAAAASLKTELMIPGASQSVTITRAGGRTPVPERESIRSYAAHRAVLALYLSSAKAEDVRRELLTGGYPETTPVSVVYKASWPEEKVIRSTVRDFPQRMREAEITETAVILVGDALGRPEQSAGAEAAGTAAEAAGAAAAGTEAEAAGAAAADAVPEAPAASAGTTAADAAPEASAAAAETTSADTASEASAAAAREAGGTAEKKTPAEPSSFLYSPNFTTGFREAERKRFVFIGCSTEACRLMRRAEQAVRDQEPETEVIPLVKAEGVTGYDPRSITDLTGAYFRSADLIVYFGAAGIAVRAIAPFVRSKAEDPAVLAVDEQGCFCISLLSGHIGKANAYAEQFAALLGAEPVITTATDLEGKFAVDLFAASHGLKLRETGRIKNISAAVLRGEVIPVWKDAALSIAALPRELRLVADRRQAALILSVFSSEEDRPDALHLVPRAVYLGIGCRKHTPEAEIRASVEQGLRQAGIFPEAAAGIGSIGLKKEEAGLLAFAEKSGLRVRFFSAEELNRLTGQFSASDFVRKTAGTDCVCERGAVCAAGETDASALILRKQAAGGVTTAAAQKKLVL